MTIIANRVERARFDVDRVHFRTRPVLMPGYYAIVGIGGLDSEHNWVAKKVSGYRYIGPVFPYEHCWEECPEIVTGIDKVYHVQTPEVFWKDGTWRLIVFHATACSWWYSHGKYAYSWWFNKWVEDNSLLEGLYCPQDPDHPERTMHCGWPRARVFWMNGELFMIQNVLWAWSDGETIRGKHRFLGWKWVDNQWQLYSEIVEGLPVRNCTNCVGSYNDAFDMLWWDGELRMIQESMGDPDDYTKMWKWDSDQQKWVRDYEHENMLWDHGGGSHGVDIGFGLFELEGMVYVLNSSFLSDAKEWVDDHWESSDMWNGIDQEQDMPWPTVFRVR